MPRLVHVSKRRPGAVVVGIKIDGLGQAGNGLIPVLGLHGETAKKELRLGELRLAVGKAEQHGPRAVVRFLFDVVARQREIRFLGRGVQRDDPFELGLGLAVFFLSPEEIGQSQMGAGVVGRKLHGLTGGHQRLFRLLYAGQPLGHLAPQERRVRVALDGLLHGGDRFLETAVLGQHLRG